MLLVTSGSESFRKILPNDLKGFFGSMAGETIMSITYGLDVQPNNDPYVETAEEGVRSVVAAAIPGAFLVDMIPFLKYVPQWFPGAGFQRKAKAWKKLTRNMVEVPFEAAKRNIVRYLPHLFSLLFELGFLFPRPLVSLVLALHQKTFKRWMRVLETMLTVKRSFKILQEPCIQRAQTQ